MSNPPIIQIVPVPQLTLGRRLLLGGLGALTPILLSLVVVDMRTLMQKADDPVEVVGYLARVIGLFGVGALTAWLHKQEFDERKLFQLGMIGPALLTTMLNGAKVPPPSSSSFTAPVVEAPGKMPVQGPVGLSSFLVAPLAAQEHRAPRQIYSFEDEPPPPSTFQRFLNGFWGTSSGRGNYFVVLDEGSFSTSDEAFRRLAQVQRLDTDFQRNAKVFSGPAADGRFVVVLGGWLDSARLRKVVEDAAEEGVPVLVFTRTAAAKALAGERAQQ
jgi:hypothetical protein